MVFTFNDASLVSPVLLDRLQVVKTDAFNQAERGTIAAQHLLPRVLREQNLSEGALRLSPQAASEFAGPADENGMRETRSALERLATKFNMWRRTSDNSFLEPLSPELFRAIDGSDCHEVLAGAGTLLRGAGLFEARRPPLGMYC